MSAVWNWLKKEAVLAIAALCALVSALFVPPSLAYVDYLDLRVLCLLFCLMVVVAGFRSSGVFSVLAQRLLGGLGTLIASLASLISFRFYAAEKDAKPAAYLGVFTLYNLAFLLLLALPALLCA